MIAEMNGSVVEEQNLNAATSLQKQSHGIILDGGKWKYEWMNDIIKLKRGK